MGEILELWEQITYRTVYLQTLCLVVHTVCAIFVCQHLIKFQDNYPYRETSPALTIVSQILLLLASATLVASGVLGMRSKDFSQPGFSRICFEGSNWMVFLNLLYTFSMEFIMFAQLLRLCRVSLIYSLPKFRGRRHHLLIRVFKKQTILLGLCFTYGLIIAIIDLLMKYFAHDGAGELKLSPQFDYFMCSKPIDVNYFIFATSIYMGKLAIYCFLFLFFFIKAGKLQRVNKQLAFRAQFMFVLILKFSTIFTDRILFIWNPNVISIFPVHFIDCASNLLFGFIFMRFYKGDGKHKKFYLPENKQFQIENLSYLLCQHQSRVALESFFEQRGKKAFLKVYEWHQNLVNDTNGHLSDQQKSEFCSKIKQLLAGPTIDPETERYSDAYYYNLSKKMEEQSKQIIEEWKRTESFAYLKREWSQNDRYQANMDELFGKEPRKNENHSIIYSTR